MNDHLLSYTLMKVRRTHEMENERTSALEEGFFPQFQQETHENHGLALSCISGILQESFGIGFETTMGFGIGELHEIAIIHMYIYMYIHM